MTYPDISTDRNPYEGYAGDGRVGELKYSERPKKSGSWLNISKSVGIYAGVLAITLAIFAIAGILWGLIRPTYTAYVEDAESASIAVETNTAFTGYAWFVIATGVLAAAIALIVFLRSIHTRGPLMLVWLGIVSTAGSAAFLVFGGVASAFLHGSPSDYADAIGESFNIAPTITPGVAIAVAPFLAVCIYWCAAFVTPEEDASEDSLVADLTNES
ncbi:hypothetical protein [Corynebacterium crudilactis]|uniref:DUF2567 domain-containing protein n=1 Tax=Corynebacterium crudilactis TaxID=1652495 RepID=A0A172QUP4_9CORY|nr:hypothetical protein [Corynebacterium crudilactis]ANE04360.1 hypothetical protein ccrud_09205 [Corynebacterium crudilactis]